VEFGRSHLEQLIAGEAKVGEALAGDVVKGGGEGGVVQGEDQQSGVAVEVNVL
jgi:hypothetical protein